jgi:hypothetical protein
MLSILFFLFYSLLIFQFDFLNDDFTKLPQSLQNIINDPEKRKKLVIYINPPYAEATSSKTISNSNSLHKENVGNSKTKIKYEKELEQASKELLEKGIDCEIIDIQSLLPFDVNQDIVKSIMKTNRLLVVDEDVPGGATSFMFAVVMDKQGGYRWLDASPRILCSQPHRPGYGSDGDYFSKPNTEDIVAMVMEMMAE